MNAPSTVTPPSSPAVREPYGLLRPGAERAGGDGHGIAVVHRLAHPSATGGAAHDGRSAAPAGTGNLSTPTGAVCSLPNSSVPTPGRRRPASDIAGGWSGEGDRGGMGAYRRHLAGGRARSARHGSVPADAGDVVPSGARRGLEPPCTRGTGRLAFGAERLAVHSGLAWMLGVARVRAAVAAGTVRLASTEHCLSGRDPPAVSERLQPGGVHFHQWEQQPRGRMEYRSDVGVFFSDWAANRFFPSPSLACNTWQSIPGEPCETIHT